MNSPDAKKPRKALWLTAALLAAALLALWLLPQPADSAQISLHSPVDFPTDI